MRHAAAAFAAALPLLAGTAEAASTDAVFTVANYPVEARAENAVVAKERALADGQQAAFRSLLKRLVPVTAYARLKRLASIKAGDLVEGVRVRAERNSATEYIANLDFSFQAKAVRELLRREGIPFTDEQAPALTVVPVWRTAAAAAPHDEPAWTGVWKGLDLEHAITPVKLQPLRKAISNDAVAALAGGDGGAIRAFAAEYRTEFVLVAIAEPDPAAQRLNVTLAGRDAAGALTLKRAYRLDSADPAYASEFAAVVALGTLEGRWKATKVRTSVASTGPAASTSGGGGDTELLISVEFRGMGEWQEISRRLSLTAGVEDLDVAGLSARGARVTLRYADGAEELAAALSRQGLSLRNAGGNWVLGLQSQGGR